jgi:hypothetical protein
MTYRIRIAVRIYLSRASKLVLAVTARLIFGALVAGQSCHEARIHTGSTNIDTGALSARQEGRHCSCEPHRPSSIDLQLSASEPKGAHKGNILICSQSNSEA